MISDTNNDYIYYKSCIFSPFQNLFKKISSSLFLKITAWNQVFAVKKKLFETVEKTGEVSTQRRARRLLRTRSRTRRRATCAAAAVVVVVTEEPFSVRSQALSSSQAHTYIFFENHNFFVKVT